MPETRTDYEPFKVTQGGVADKATRVEFRKDTDEVTVCSELGVTSWSPTGVDGETIDAGAFALAAGELHTMKLPQRKYGNPPVLFVANDTATTGLTRFDPVPRNGSRRHKRG